MRQTERDRHRFLLARADQRRHLLSDLFGHIPPELRGVYAARMLERLASLNTDSRFLDFKAAPVRSVLESDLDDPAGGTGHPVEEDDEYEAGEADAEAKRD